MGTGEVNAGGNPAMDLHPIQGGVEILLVASCYRNWDKLRPDGPPGLYSEFAYLAENTSLGFARCFLQPLLAILFLREKIT